MIGKHESMRMTRLTLLCATLLTAAWLSTPPAWAQG